VVIYWCGVKCDGDERRGLRGTWVPLCFWNEDVERNEREMREK
jgi:hypothetical protein